MPTLRARWSYVLTVGATSQDFASPFIAPQLDLVTIPNRYTVKVPFGTTVTLWDATAGGGNPTAFSFLLLHSDIEVEIEQKVLAAGPLTSLNTFTLAADHIPYTLGSNVGRAGTLGSDAFAGGTLGVITKFRAKNNSTDTDAYVEVVVGGA